MFDKLLLKIIAFLFLLMFLVSCSKMLPKAPAEEDLLDGPVEGLNAEETIRFLNGDRAFNDEIFNGSNGLGTIFVATSCGSCHAGDGKGHPFTTLTRFGQTDSTGNKFLAFGGPQLQNRALPGYKPETIPAGATFSNFTPPANTGLGFLELVSDADLIAMSDPDDLNGDGLSGVPNWISLPPFVVPSSNAVSVNGKYIHRFGKKAAAYNLLHQTVNAYNQDIGITSIFDLKDVYTGLEIDPEIPTQTVLDVVFYLQTLKAPIQRSKSDPLVNAGYQAFLNIGCNACHKEKLKTGYSPISALSNKEFYPFTDMLLHDMGPGLDDGYTEGSAKTYEWRTPALWGLGLSPNSQGGSYFLMHDGRAKTIEEAILMHGGEASSSKLKYQNLSKDEKNNVLKFLESL